MGLNPNLSNFNVNSREKIFPMQGLWRSSSIFKTTAQDLMSARDYKEQCKNVDKRTFKLKYKEKDFMEEMLKTKNMMKGARK